MLKGKKIFLLRHGETEYNRMGRYQGVLDSPLTRLGIAQVEKNAMLLKNKLSKNNGKKHIRFYSSPLGRAKQSSEIIKAKLGKPDLSVAYTSDLQEVNIGSWNGKNIQEINGGKVNMDQFNWYFHSPDGETYEAVVQRCKNWIQTVERNQEDTIIVMSHGLLGRVLRGGLLGIDYEEAIHLDVPQNGFFEIQDQKISFITDSYEEF